MKEGGVGGHEGGKGGRNFDLESKHMIFAYQVLRQSGGKKKNVK